MLSDMNKSKGEDNKSKNFKFRCSNNYLMSISQRYLDAHKTINHYCTLE